MDRESKGQAAGATAGPLSEDDIIVSFDHYHPRPGIVISYGNGYTMADAKAKRDRIVEAVNGHAALLAERDAWQARAERAEAALAGVVAWYDGNGALLGPAGPYENQIIGAARAVLAAAKE